MSLKNNINRWLRKFNVELHGTGYLQSLAKGEFKKNEYDFFESFFGNQPIVIVDAGANRGTTVANFFRSFPQSAIHAFEPIQSLCDEIKLQFGTNTKLSINCCGLGEQPGSLTFFVNKSLDTSSFLPSQKTGLNSDAQVQTVSEVTVPVQTLDGYVEKNQISHIHLLKLDIQGSELNALKGAAALLKHQQVDVIYTEAYFIQQYTGQPLFFDIAAYLMQFGYVLQDIYNPIYGNNRLAWCDAVFVKAINNQS